MGVHEQEGYREKRAAPFPGDEEISEEQARLMLAGPLRIVWVILLARNFLKLSRE